MIVHLFVPCFIDQLYPQTAFSVIRILKKAGVEVVYNPEQTCCGQPAYNSGHHNEARKLAVKFMKDFDDASIIVSPSASCTGYIRKYYEKLLPGGVSVKRSATSGMNKEPNFGERHVDTNKLDNHSGKNVLSERFSGLKESIYELSDFLVNRIQITELGAIFPHKVTYHDACSALREYGIRQEPRILLNKVQGLELVEMKETETCCGFGGTFAARFHHISTGMTIQKVENALASGAEYIVSTEASCLMNMESYIRSKNLPIKTIHLADILG